jgi:hypothetical protein
VTKSGQVYAFNPVTNTSLNLTSFFIGPSISNYNLDIAHTEETLWLLGETHIQEWDIVSLFPFSVEYSRLIELPNINVGNGLGVINDTTLVISRSSDVPNIPDEILLLDITTNTGVPSSLFFLTNGRFVTGDISYNSSNKLLITNQDGEGNTFVNQYDLTEGPEVEINITSTVPSPAGLYSFDNNIFVVNNSSDGQSYSMDLNYPYNITFETNINERINGTSQLTDCFKQSFRITPLLPTPSGTATPTPTPTICFTTIVTIEATPPSADAIVNVSSNGIGNDVNTLMGTIIHDPFNPNGTSPGNIYLAVLDTNSVWKNTSSSDGPLNRSGIWATDAVNFPILTWLGFSVCITVPETKTYWIGLGADNSFRFVVDGVEFVNTFSGPYCCPSGGNLGFIYWHVYPVNLSVGDHVIELYGLNRTFLGDGVTPSAAGFGCEIYDNTAEELISATDLSDLNILFSSSGQTSATTVQTLTGNYTSSGYSCPDGYTFNPCDLTCFIEIDPCAPTPTPTRTKTPTPTLTKTPTPSPTRCCFNFDMYGGTQTGGSNFEVTYCDNTTSEIQVNQFTMYSTQYGSSLCAFDVIRLSGNGIVYTGSCGCINPTSTPTPTPTITPTKLPIFDDCGLVGSGFTTNTEVVTSCEILLRGQSKLYKYDTNSPDTSTELVIPNLTITPADITHTETRLFAQFGSTSNTIIDSIRVWDLNLSPFGADFIEDISLDFEIGWGIFALSNTTLIVSTGSTTSCFIEIDITDPVYIGVTDKFCLSPNRKVSRWSNFILTDNGKLIVSNTHDDGFSPITYHLTQFDYTTGFEEQDVLVASEGNTTFNNFVIIESETQLLIGKNDIYNVPLNSPYSPLTLFGNPTAISDIYGASQKYNVGCLPVELTPVSVGLCDALVRAESRIYKYSFSSPNESAELVVPNLSVSAGDLTHTEGKLFTQFKQGGPVGPYYNYLRVWDITLSPFVATYSQDISLNFNIGPGILAIDDFTIIAATGTTTSCFIQMNITDPNNISVTPLFCLATGRKVSPGSNFILNDNSKLIIPNFINSTPETFYITQYDYDTSEFEVDFQVSNPIVQNSGFVLLESSTQILAGYSDLYQIPNESPYSPVSLFGNPNVAGSNMYGASQLLFAGCMNIDFQPQVSPTQTPTPTQTVTKTSTNTPTITKTPNATPTNTNTSTVTPTNTNTPTSTKTNTITVIGSFNLTYNPFDISSDSASLRYYSYSQDGTEILDSEYKDVDSLSFSASSGDTKAKVLFDPTNFKMYFGSLDNQFIDVYDIVGLSTSQIDLSSYNASAWDMTLDVNNGVLGIITGQQSPNGKVIFISTSTDTVYGQFTGTSSGYRGAITNNSAGYVATVSATEDSIRTYNSTVPLTGTTIPISANTGGYRSIVFNETNAYYYVLTFGNSLEWVDPSLGSLGSISLTGYSGSNINSSMIYNPSNDRIYILNVKSNGNYGIITVDCLTNTILNFTDSLLTGGGTGAYEGGMYLDIITSPNELLLWTKTNKSVYRLSIP